MLSHLSKQHFWYFKFFSRNCSTKLNSTTNPLHPHNATVYSLSTPASPNPLCTRSDSLLYISIFIIHSIPSPLFFHFNPTCSNLTAVYNDLTILHPLFFFRSTLFNIGFTPIPLKFLLLFLFYSDTTLDTQTSLSPHSTLLCSTLDTQTSLSPHSTLLCSTLDTQTSLSPHSTLLCSTLDTQTSLSPHSTLLCSTLDTQTSLSPHSTLLCSTLDTQTSLSLHSTLLCSTLDTQTSLSPHSTLLCSTLDTQTSLSPHSTLLCSTLDTQTSLSPHSTLLCST